MSHKRSSTIQSTITTNVKASGTTLGLHWTLPPSAHRGEQREECELRGPGHRGRNDDGKKKRKLAIRRVSALIHCPRHDRGSKNGQRDHLGIWRC
jgi:hypothetical protein